MPFYKEDSFLVVYPGTDSTLFSFGLQDLLSPPQYRIPSVVFQDAETKQYHAQAEEKLVEIRPIEAGKIRDLDAFNYLLKVILQSVIKINPIITINQIPLLVITPSLTWLRSNVEYVTKYVIESLEFTAFNVLDLSIAATFGIGSSTNATVVKVGPTSTQVVPVVGNQAIKFASKYVDVGGNLLNNELQGILPKFSPQQIEDLKVSGIYEVLNNHEGSFYSFADLTKEEAAEDFDVAKMVAGTNDIKALAEDSEEEPKPNKELETNYFIDSATKEKVFVGKERFQGSGKLVKAIADAIYALLAQIPDIEKRQDCYDNLIFVGLTFQIPGLKEAILYKIVEQYLVKNPSSASTNSADGVNPAILAYQQAEEANDDGANNLAQVPSTVKISKYPEYFSEWKKPKEKGGSWHDVFFLGAQIYAKQIFSYNSNHGRELFVDSDIYEEKGPQSIWDVSI